MRRSIGTLLLVALGVFGVACSSGAKSERDEAVDVVGTPPTPAEDPFFYIARPPVDAKADATGTIGDVEPPPKPAAEPETKPPKVDPVPDRGSERISQLEAAARTARREAEQAQLELERVQRESMLAAAARDEAEAKAVELRATNVQLRGELEDARAGAARLQAQLEDARTGAARLQAQLEDTRASASRVQAKLEEAPKVTRSDLNQCHSCVKLCPMDGKCADDAELVCGWGAGKDRENAMLRARTECNGALQSLRHSGAFSRVAGTCPAASCVQ